MRFEIHCEVQSLVWGNIFVCTCGYKYIHIYIYLCKTYAYIYIHVLLKKKPPLRGGRSRPRGQASPPFAFHRKLILPHRHPSPLSPFPSPSPSPASNSQLGYLGYLGYLGCLGCLGYLGCLGVLLKESATLVVSLYLAVKLS